MVELAASLTLYANTPITDAMAMTPSMAKAFFDGKPFSDWKRGREADAKLQAAIVNRLNEVIRGLGVVAKAVGGRR